MLLELAIGDAYGAGFEYADENVRCCNDLSRYVQHPTHRSIQPGRYTDDTQMSLAIAELIVEQTDWTPLNIAQRFVECFKRDPRQGYAGRFYQFLRDVSSGAEFLAQIQPDSDKSGAAMRACAIGILPTVAEVLERCTLQAKLTHNTPDGVAAACAAALLSHYFLYDLGVKKDVGKFIQAQLPSSFNHLHWQRPYVGAVKSKGWMSVRAAITAVLRNDRLSDLLKDCIAFTGDVDTVATIALAAAAHSREYTQDLPAHLVQTLENGTYGRDYITALDQRLLKLKAN
jgi:ADP-ribosylglycohydrolase